MSKLRPGHTSNATNTFDRWIGSRIVSYSQQLQAGKNGPIKFPDPSSNVKITKKPN